jgi:N-acyl-D-amino-acid deacylase
MSKRALLVLSAVVAASVLRAQGPDAYDVIIRHGTLLDGSGNASYRADVGIAGGSIARIGDLTNARAATEIDANALDVAPGFINIHSHAMPDGLVHAANMLTQGVTTEILNADGAGPIDIAGQLARVTARGVAVNVGASIGFNSVWAEVVGLSDRRATDADIARMRSLVTAGLEAGAFGVSAGLDYKPAYFAHGEEVIKVIDVARAWRTFLNETIAIGERSGVVPVITHMKVQGQEQGSADRILSSMRDASARGAYVAADVYPYLAGQTGLVALIIPGWAQDGGREAMLKRFADPTLRARIVQEAEDAMNARFGGAAGVYLP